MAKKVVVRESLSDQAKQMLKDQGLEVIDTDGSIDDALKKAPDAYGILLGSNPFSNEDILKFKNLKVIARSGVGYNNIDIDFAAQHGIWVTITPNANAATVAETTLAEIMDVSKNIYGDSTAMREGDFSGYKHSHLGFDLEGKTLGIIGFGRIGQMIAKKSSQLDMNIVYNNRTKRDNPYATYMDRDELIQKADIISLALSVNPATERSFGQREFDMMKPTAVFINTARGQLVDTDAMVNALQTGKIAGAALDVFDEEPLPMDSPLYQLDNVLLTPHIASNTIESVYRMDTGAASEIIKVVADEQQPQWPVNEVK